MSIWKESEGILGTLVTWEDIQKDCFDLFGPTARLGEAKTVRDIADGKGFISRIGVVENPWEDGNLAEKNGWPTKFVVKIATALQQGKYSKKLEAEIGSDKKIYTDDATDKLTKKIQQLHNMECTLYKKFAQVAEMNLLKVYVSYPFSEENPDRGYLIMEFVENTTNFGNDTHMEEELLLEILEILARYHSLTSLFNEEERKSMELGIISDHFAPMLVENFIDSLMDVTTNFLGDQAGDLVDRFRTLATRLAKPDLCEKMDNVAEILGMKRVLAHGDPWTCNLLCTQINGGKIHLRALIDLQTTHFGCIGHDLARLFSNVLTYEQRQEKISFYLDKYYQFVTSFWNKNEVLPFTRDQIDRAYHAYLPLNCYVVAVSTAALGETRCSQSEDPERVRRALRDKVTKQIRTLEENFDCLVNLSK